MYQTQFPNGFNNIDMIYDKHLLCYTEFLPQKTKQMPATFTFVRFKNWSCREGFWRPLNVRPYSPVLSSFKQIYTNSCVRWSHREIPFINGLDILTNSIISI